MNQDLLSYLTEAVSAASAEGRLIDERELAEASSRHFTETPEITPPQIAQALGQADAKKIGRLDGAEVHRYYDRTKMADSYAETLNLIDEGDMPRMIAETVRTESRVYPRPTMTDAFLGAPFNLDKSEISGIADALVADAEDYKDIEETAASNGDRYLYSSRFLSKARAHYLAEWESVEQLENQ